MGKATPHLWKAGTEMPSCLKIVGKDLGLRRASLPDLQQKSTEELLCIV